MSSMTDAELVAEARRLTVLLGEHSLSLTQAHRRGQLAHAVAPLAIAVPESFAAEVVNGARCLDLPLVRAAVAFPTLLMPAKP